MIPDAPLTLGALRSAGLIGDSMLADRARLFARTGEDLLVRPRITESPRSVGAASMPPAGRDTNPEGAPMTSSITEATAVTQWGVKLTWPDGHTEVQEMVGRHGAEIRARTHNSRDQVPGVAEVVTRTVTTTSWAVAS